MKRTKQRSGVVVGVEEDIEQTLEQYLRDRGWAYRCKQKADHKLPERVILLDDEPAAIIEASPLAAEELLHSLRERSQQKQKQVNATVQQHLPFLLATGGKMLKDIPSNTLELFQDNPQVSALGILHRSSALGLARMVQDEPTMTSDMTSEAGRLLGVIDDLLQKRWEIELSAREQSRIPDVEILWMEILLNPYATYPWLDELTGVYDKVYVWDESHQQWGLRYDGTPAVLRTLATRLLAGIVNAPFTDDVDASRSANFYEEREPTLHTA